MRSILKETGRRGSKLVKYGSGDRISIIVHNKSIIEKGGVVLSVVLMCVEKLGVGKVNWW